VVGNPGHPVRVEGRRPEGPDADWVHLPDPIADAIKGLSARIAALEEDRAGGGAEIRELRATERDRREGGTAAAGANRSIGPNPAGG
jgi:serine O-acetyltransferase